MVPWNSANTKKSVLLGILDYTFKKQISIDIFIHLLIMFHQIWSVVSMKRLKSLGKFQDGFIYVFLRKLLILLYNFPKISNL